MGGSGRRKTTRERKRDRAKERKTGREREELGANREREREICAAARSGILYTMRERKINELNM